ncbi:hypothetical protein CRUP_026498 [Coryphaenoides rupestris]|nr:hypothetical protein CRUP_026498 [Coryphaenoides rupestris]
MAICHRKTSVLCAMMILVFICLVVVVSRNLGKHKHKIQKAIRQSWGQAGNVANRTVVTVFLLGTTTSADNFPNLSGMLSHEAELHRDLLQWDYRDSFFNLTLKETLFLEWFSQHCSHANYVLKGDDDVFVNTWQIIRYLELLPEVMTKELFVGDVIQNASPHRDNRLKYFVPARMCLKKLGLVPEKHKGFRTFDVDKKYRENPILHREGLQCDVKRLGQEAGDVMSSNIFENDAPNVSDEQVDEGGRAFFALRGCHQILHGESGEFFSPDYLCSNPPLWCNWTIQVDPRMRIQLYLEDLIQPDVCHLKQDQIHVDEAMGFFGGHKILQKCWREAKYISISNTLHVVLLIGGHPGYSYRGFYGRYQAFGPPAVYNPLDKLKEHDKKALPHAHPNVVEQLTGHRTSDHLFEVAVEVNFQHNPEEHWDRIARLSAGVLYIFWLQIAEGSPGPHPHATLHAALQELIETPVQLPDSQRHAVVVSVSTAECRSGPSPTVTQGVYVVFFLLSFLILTLLAAVAVMYRRHRRGTFLVGCDGFTADTPKSIKCAINADADLPPPPPPIRRPKDGWPHSKDCCPHTDVPLLRFNPILPLDGLMDPPEELRKH